MTDILKTQTLMEINRNVKSLADWNLTSYILAELMELEIMSVFFPIESPALLAQWLVKRHNQLIIDIKINDFGILLT